MADLHLRRPRSDVSVAPAAVARSERRAPIRGAAATLLQLQTTAGNQVVQRLLRAPASLTAVGIQREYVPTPAEERDFGEIPQWWPEATPKGARDLVVKWCKGHNQFESLLRNFSWAEFLALTKKYPAGEKVPVKAGAIRAQMAREMKEELKALWAAQVEKYRATGKPGYDMTYDKFFAQKLLTVRHIQTFRTLDEKKDGPRATGPYTRNFSASVDGKAAAWEIHVHYAGNGSAQKAHAKLITQRTSKEHVADLKVASNVVQSATGAVVATIDTSARAHVDW